MDNIFLKSLSSSDLATVQALLKPLELVHKKILFEAGQSISKVYFPTNAIVSLVVLLSTGETVEAAMVGRDGLVGGSSTLNGKIAVYRAVVQVGGEGLVCDGNDFKEAALKSRTLLAKVIRHEQALYVQAQQSAACNAAHQVEARMARWLLRARDLTGSDQLDFTQEFVAEMLGVRRTSVSGVASHLQDMNLIKYNRGIIHIIDVVGLKATACECYATVRKSYKELLGS
jgi:CRP-like cAMP-binding protein